MDEALKTYDQDHAASVAERGFFQNLEHGLSTACKTLRSCKICGKLSGGTYMPLYTADIWAFRHLTHELSRLQMHTLCGEAYEKSNK